MKKQHFYIFYIWQGVCACLIGCFMFAFVFVGAGAWAQTETQTQPQTQDQPELKRPRFIPDSVIGIMIGHNNDLFFRVSGSLAVGGCLCCRDDAIKGG